MAVKHYTLILLAIILYSATLQNCHLVSAQRKRRSREEETEVETHMTNQQEVEEVEKLEREAEV